MHLGYQYNPTEPVTACNLCGRDAFTVIATQDRAGFPATSVMCNECSLVFITPRMSAADYAEFYASGMYRQIVCGLRGFSNEQRLSEMHEGQQFYAASVCSVVGERLSRYRDGTLLDIGGSTGIVAAEIGRQFSLTGTVLDPATSELAEAAARGLRTVEGSIESWDTDERFDVVGIFQSVDHFLDIAGALAKVRRLLKPGGLFLVDIVEVRTMIKHCGTVQASKIDHPFGLSDWTMRTYLARAGFAPVQIATTTDKRKIFYVCETCEPENVLPPYEAVDEMRQFVWGET